MSWVKLDDRLPHHRKVRAIAPGQVLAAFGLHAAALCFAQHYETDGRIRPEDLTVILPTRTRPLKVLIQELVRVRLWDVHADGGWIIHDYLEWNASARERKEKARAAANARWGVIRHARSTAESSTPSTAVSMRVAMPSSPLLSAPLHSAPLHSAGGGSEGGPEGLSPPRVGSDSDGPETSAAVNPLPAALQYPVTEQEAAAAVKALTQGLAARKGIP